MTKMYMRMNDIHYLDYYLSFIDILLGGLFKVFLYLYLCIGSFFYFSSSFFCFLTQSRDNRTKRGEMWC